MTSKRLGLRSESSARFERGVDPNGGRARVRPGGGAADRGGRRARGRARESTSTRSPVERERISVRPAGSTHVLGHRARCRRGAGRARARSASTSTTVATATPSSPRCRRSAPTSTARSTSSRRSVAAIGLDSIPRTLPHTTEQGGGLTARQRDRRPSPTCSSALGLARRSPSRCVARRTSSAAGAPRRRPRPRHERAARRGAGAATRDPPRPAEGGRVQPLGTGSPTSRSSSSATSSDARRRLGAASRRARPPRAWCSRARCAAGRSSPTARSTCTTRWMRCTLSSTRSSSRSHARAGGHRRLPTRAQRSVLVGGADAGVVGEVADAVVDAFGLDRPVVAFEVELDGLVAAPRRDRQFHTASRFPASTIDLAFVLADTVPADAVTRTLRDAVGAFLEDVRPFDEFRRTRSGADAAASRSRCGSARPITRSPTPRSPTCGSGRSTR